MHTFYAQKTSAWVILPIETVCIEMSNFTDEPVAIAGYTSICEEHETGVQGRQPLTVQLPSVNALPEPDGGKPHPYYMERVLKRRS
jgi:hypothetical protein